MAQVHFLPHFAEVLDEVVAAAFLRGRIDVAVRPDVDAAVVAGQVQRYAADLGRPLRARPAGDRVEVRPAHLRSHPAGERAG